MNESIAKRPFAITSKGATITAAEIEIWAKVERALSGKNALTRCLFTGPNMQGERLSKPVALDAKGSCGSE